MASLEICCDSDVIVCGCVLTGMVRVRTHSGIKFRSIRLRFRGGEEARVRRTEERRHGSGKTTTTHHYEEYTNVTFIENYFTLAGAMDTGSKMTLAPGKYEYPFSFVVPDSLPPSFSFSTPQRGCAVSYTLKATIDIPFAFDEELEIELPLREAVSLRQLTAARQRACIFRPVKTLVNNNDFFICCSSSKDVLQLEVAVAPRIIVIHSGCTLPETAALGSGQTKDKEPCGESDGAAAAWPPLMAMSGNPGEATVCVRVTNMTRKVTVQAVEVTLKMHYLMKDPGGFNTEHDHSMVLARATGRFAKGLLQPNQRDVATVHLRVSKGPKASDGTPPLPTITTNHFRTYTVLKVECVGCNVDTPFKAENTIFMTDVIDLNNKCTDAPRKYYSSAKKSGRRELTGCFGRANKY